MFTCPAEVASEAATLCAPFVAVAIQSMLCSRSDLFFFFARVHLDDINAPFAYRDIKSKAKINPP